MTTTPNKYAEIPSDGPVLYWFSDDERVLYVGVTRDLKRRIRQHRNTKKWWPRVRTLTYQPHPSIDAALQAEATAIRKLRPIYNQQHKEPNVLADFVDIFFGGYLDAPVTRVMKAARRGMAR